MMAVRGVTLLLLFVALAQPGLARQAGSTAANPIRRVVSLLQRMQTKIEAEGKTQLAIFDKYMCWCKTGGSDLAKSIADAETKIPQVESSIKEAESQLAQLASDLKQAKADRAEAKDVVAQGKALRAKEAAAFAKESAEYKSNIGAMTQAIAALEKGMTGFLQTATAGVLRKLTVSMETLSSSDRDALAAFLSEGQGQQEGYVPQSGEIVGILKQMLDTMEADLADITAAEEKAKADFAGMLKAKTAQIEALTAAIEDKTVRQGNLGVELVNMREDLDDTQKSYLADKGFLKDLEANCKTKEAEWTEISKTRADELLAIHETIQILNDDDSLELFKKTLPSTALLQVGVNQLALGQKALAALKAHKGPKDFRLDLIALALKGKKVDFQKVLGMIDSMVELLGKEQTTDDEKKAYCEAELDTAEDQEKALQHAIDDLETHIDETKEGITTVTTEIAALEKGIADLDKAVAEATEQRKTEHAENEESLVANNAAKDLIGIAKNRLQKFYNPKLYKPPPKRELSAEDRIAVNMGGTAPPTAAPGGIAGTGVTALNQGSAAPPPPPEAVPAYQTKGQEAGGVLAMLDMLVADLDKEIQETQVEEKNSQQEYEGFMADSAAKRGADSASIAEKESAKADLGAALTAMTEEKKGKVSEAMAKAEYIQSLHLECDWLLSNFEVRKEARAGEVAALKQAKAVLSGADYSMVQMEHKTNLRRVARA